MRIADALEFALLKDRSSFIWSPALMVPTSSRKSVPGAPVRAAPAVRHGARERAANMAEQLCSSSVSGIALQLSATNRCKRRGLLWWMARATTSFPVPVSPAIRSVLLVAPRFPAAEQVGHRAALADDPFEPIALSSCARR